MVLKNQVHRVDADPLMAKMVELQSSSRKLWPGQAHLYHEGYPVHPLNFKALSWPMYSHEVISVTLHHAFQDMTTPGPPPLNTFLIYYLASSTSNIFESAKLAIFFLSKFNFTVMCHIKNRAILVIRVSIIFPQNSMLTLLSPTLLIYLIKIIP